MPRQPRRVRGGAQASAERTAQGLSILLKVRCRRSRRRWAGEFGATQVSGLPRADTNSCPLFHRRLLKIPANRDPDLPPRRMQILWLKSLRKKLCAFYPLPQPRGGNSAPVSVETRRRRRRRLSLRAGLRRPPLPHPVGNTSHPGTIAVTP